MGFNHLLPPPSDEEIYQRLVSLEPNYELFCEFLKFQKLHLLHRLITDFTVDEAKRDLWKKLIRNQKKYINDTFEDL